VQVELTTELALTAALIVGTKGTRSKLQTWGKVLGGESTVLSSESRD
jgi:hypothetical protein